MTTTEAKHVPPNFPVPDFDGPTVAFGASRKDYLTAEQMGPKFYAMRGPFCDAASSLFYSGGKLADYNLKFKPEIDSKKAFAAIRALLGSYDPSHEIKIGTVGVALSQWCDLIEPPK